MTAEFAPGSAICMGWTGTTEGSSAAMPAFTRAGRASRARTADPSSASECLGARGAAVRRRDPEARERIPLAVIRRQARASELARVVPECCGLVLNAVRAQQARGGRHVAVDWDRSRRLEVGVELLGPFAEHGEVVQSATPAGAVASTTHFGPYGGLGAAHDAIQRWCEANTRPLAGPELGNLRSLAERLERPSVPNPNGRLLSGSPSRIKAVQLNRSRLRSFGVNGTAPSGR